MIQIIESNSVSVVGDTSLFISFEYNSCIVDFIKSLGGCSFSKRSRQWEIPAAYLAYLLDFLCQFDDISLTLMSDSVPQTTNTSFEVNPLDYKLPLYDFQLDAVKYGLCHDKWLLLDPPGLGKTAVIIHIIEELIKSGELQHCLVICGINVIKENWIKEINKHSNTLTATILGQRTTRTGNKVIGSVSDRINQLANPINEQVVITNIETIRNNDIVELIENGPNKFDMIVCDEIHVVKNSTSQQGSNFLKLIKHKYKIGATGTLLMNSPLDAYVPLTWIGKNRATITNFKGFYCNYRGPILQSYKNVDLLKQDIYSCSLRRPKSLLNLPPLTLIDEYVEMDKDQSSIYNEVKQGIRDQIDKVILRRSNLLACISRLRQATACPSILTTKSINSAKIDRCCDLVDQIVSGGEKVLIFSTYKETVRMLSERLANYNPLVCTGDTPDFIISESIDKFQTEDTNKCFICTWQKCGTGSTLTAATYVIFIDTAWSYAAFEQHFSRAYRAGTSKNVIVYTIIARNTVDELVRNIVYRKDALSRYIVDDNIDDDIYDILLKYIQDL